MRSLAKLRVSSAHAGRSGLDIRREAKPSPHPSARARSRRPLQWPDLAEGRLRLERLCHNGWSRLSSPADAPPARCAGTPDRRHSSRSNKVAPAPSSAALRSQSSPHRASATGTPRRCGVARLRPPDRHRGRNGAGSEDRTETEHGHHRHLQEDRHQRVHRRHRTLGVQARGVRIIPDTRATGENAPSHGSWSAAPRSGPPGPSAPPRAATIWASSSTIRASTPPSTPTSSMTRTARISPSSGPAPTGAAATDVRAAPRPARPGALSIGKRRVSQWANRALLVVFGSVSAGSVGGRRAGRRPRRREPRRAAAPHRCWRCKRTARAS